MVEQFAVNEKVAGSNPASGAMKSARVLPRAFFMMF